MQFYIQCFPMTMTHIGILSICEGPSVFEWRSVMFEFPRLRSEDQKIYFYSILPDEHIGVKKSEQYALFLDDIQLVPTSDFKFPETCGAEIITSLEPTSNPSVTPTSATKKPTSNPAISPSFHGSNEKGNISIQIQNSSSPSSTSLPILIIIIVVVILFAFIILFLARRRKASQDKHEIKLTLNEIQRGHSNSIRARQYIKESNIDLARLRAQVQNMDYNNIDVAPSFTVYEPPLKLGYYLDLNREEAEKLLSSAANAQCSSHGAKLSVTGMFLIRSKSQKIFVISLIKSSKFDSQTGQFILSYEHQVFDFTGPQVEVKGSSKIERSSAILECTNVAD
eukprot:UC4_evm1s1499